VAAFVPINARTRFMMTTNDLLPRRFDAEVARRLAQAAPEAELSIRWLADRLCCVHRSDLR